jgi:hypothetical protein
MVVLIRLMPDKPNTQGNTMTKREQLLEEAKTLGLSFPKNAKTETIEKAVNVAKEEQAAEAAFEEAGGKVETTTQNLDELRKQMEEEFRQKLEDEKRKMAANLEVNMAIKNQDTASQATLIGQAKLKARREALKLVRVNVTCKDPMKSSWEGEIISAGNDVIGDVKKYIPFDTDDGWHVPQIIINILESKECTVFKRKRGADGQHINEARQIKAYNIEYLDPLSQEELDELAREQAAANNID